MSLSTHSHGRANSVSTTATRAAGPVVLALLLAVALATLPGGAAAQMAVASDGSTTTVDQSASAAGTSGPSLASDDIEAVGTMGTSEYPDAVVASGEPHADGTASAVRAQTTEMTRVDATGLPVRDASSGPTTPVGPAHDEDVRAYLTGSGQADASAVAADSAVRGEQIERPWGLDPSAPVSPATIGGTAIGFLLGAGAFAVARPREFRTPWFPPASSADVDGEPDLENPDGDDLVPDEAIVEGMLLRQEGRMKQSAIVEMTDWSKAKVSRLLSTMAEEGRVVKVSIGRENLICLDGWEPDAVKGQPPI